MFLRKMILLFIVLVLVGCSPQAPLLVGLEIVPENSPPQPLALSAEITARPGETLALVFERPRTKLLREITFSHSVSARVEGNKVSFMVPDKDMVITIPKSIAAEQREIVVRIKTPATQKEPAQSVCTGVHTISAYLTGYPEIKLYNDGGILLTPSDTVTFQSGCPLDRKLVEEDIRQQLHRVNCAIVWHDDSTFILSLKERPEGILDIPLTDSSGNRFAQDLFVWFELVEPMAIKWVDLRTGDSSSVGVPVGVSAASRMSLGFKHAILGRRIPMYANHHRMQWLTMVFDMATQKIVEFTEDWLRDDEVHAALEFLGKIEGPKPYYVGLSHSGQQAAAIQLEHAEKAKIILSLSRGRIEIFPSSVKVTEDEWDMYIGHPTEPFRLYWSHDDGLIFYSFNGASYKFNSKTGKEEPLRSDRIVIASSPHSPVLVAAAWDHENYDYYILDYSGKETWFAAGGPSRLHILRWLDSNTFIYSHEDKCYIHDITTGKSKFISTGVAFDYDPSSNRVFILDRVR